MSIVSLIAPERNLIDEIVPLLAAEGRDYSNTVVVFPGKRPAHALRSALAKKIGGSFLPPKIFSIDHFIDYLLEEKLQTHVTSLEAIDAAALLHEIYLADPHRPGGDHFASLDAFLPLGMKIFSELEELLLADVPLRRVRETLSGIAFGGFTSLLVFYEQLYSVARERNFATRSMRYRAVAARVSAIDGQDISKLIFAGFFAFTNTEKTIFRHFASLDNVVQIFQNGPGMIPVLKELGISPAQAEGERKEPSFHFYRSADSHGQVFVLSDKINAMVKSDHSSVEHTAIVLPASETLFPLFHQSLALLPDDEYNISLGYPVTRTPVYGFLETLMELLATKDGQRYSIPSYIKFALHPYTKNVRLGNRSDVTRILFNTIEDLFLRGRTASFFMLEELEGNTSLFERAAKRVAGIGEAVSAESLKEHLRFIHDRTIRQIDRPDSIGEFAAKAIAVIGYIDAHSTARLHPFFRPFAEALVENLNAVSSSLLKGKAFTATGEYVLFLRNYIAQSEVPFTGTPLHGLQVLGFLETRNLQFDTVFVLDANDDVIPGSKGHDVLLPFKLRESLGLATYRDRERVAEYYFHLLLAGAKDVHFFFTEGGKKEKSRFLEKLLWRKEQQKHTAGYEEYLRTVRYRVQLSNPVPEPVPKTDAVIRLLRDSTFTATALDTYLRCQLRFYYAFVLQLRERADVSGELDQADIGSFIHLLLASYFRQFKGRKLTRETVTVSSLERTIEECFSKEFGRDPVGALFLLKNQTRSHLKEFLLEYQLPLLDEDVKLLDVEMKSESSIGSYRIGGTLDRVEQRGDQIYILDYKTGGSDKHTRIQFDKLNPDDRDTWSESIGSVQLPLYAILYANATSTPIGRIVPAYLFLGRQEINKEIEHSLFDEPSGGGEKMKILQKIILGLLDEIMLAAHPFIPTDNVETECPRCAFKYICGTQWAGE